MNIKALALVIALALAGCQQAIEPSTTPIINERMVAKIYCSSQVGSGVQIGGNTIITAEHVIRNGGCNVVYRGTTPVRSLTVLNAASNADFAELASRQHLRGRTLPTSCQGVVAGQTYWLAGYPAGGDLRVVEVQATSQYIRGVTPDSRYTIDNLRVMQGMAQKGMSGGPVINQLGEVVGVISSVSMDGSNRTMIKELKHTWLCAREQSSGT